MRTAGVWQDGRGTELGSFTSWAPGEPNDGHNCALIIKGVGRDRRDNWADTQCNLQHRYICEVENDPKDWARKGPNRYKVFLERKTYSAAQRTCEASDAQNRGRLAVIKTEAVYNFLLTLIRRADPKGDYWFGMRKPRVSLYLM
ncbi:uncharacterized protein LOC144863083 [Branchiostoma floridae x Branchiostoma japonicum]